MKSKISFIIPVYNEAHRIQSCLNRIFEQDYPHDQIEIMIADGRSTDNTVAQVEAWVKEHRMTVRILDNERRVAEFGKSIAIQECSGDYIVLLDADNHLVGNQWINNCLKAFSVFPDIFGVESLYLPIKGEGLLNNYLTASLHISDPLARDMAIPPQKKAKIKKDGKVFKKYLLRPGYPTGANGFMYKRESIQAFIDLDTFEEGQVSLALGQTGHAAFAQIKGHGVQHFFVKRFRDYLKKRAKIALKHQTRIQERETWVHHTGKRLYIFAILHLSFVYPLLFSFYKIITTLDLKWIIHAPIAWITTWIYAWNWLKIKISGKKAW